jgi:hypothetical protein
MNAAALGDVKETLEGLKEVVVMDLQIQERNRTKEAEDPLSAAIALVEANDGFDDKQKADAIDVFVNNDNMARAFTAIQNAATRSKWISRRIGH